MALWAALAAALGSTGYAQGETGFLRGAGGLDVVLSWHTDEFPERIDLGLGATADGEVDRTSVSLYGAYGLTDSIDLTANATYASADGSGGVTAPDEDDLQNLVLGAKIRLREWDVGQSVFSLLVAPGVKLPMTDYEEDGYNSLGSGQIDLRARLIGHVQGARGGWFASVESGYDRRNGTPTDEIPLNLMVGANPLRLFWITPFYSRSFRRSGGEAGTGVFAGDEDFSRWGVSLYAPLHENLGLTAGWRRSSDGRERGDIDGYSIGVVFKL